MPQFDIGLVLAGRYHDWLLSGFVVSLQLAGMTLLLALPLGMAVALLRLAPFAPLRALGWLYVESIHNVPLLAHLLFWYFGVPAMLPEGLREWLQSGNIELLCAVVGLTLYCAAYMAEDVRSGIRAVPAGQLDAARALGFGFLGAMRLVVLPQAIRITVPPLISRTLSLWKDTSIATVIGVAEMMAQAARVESDSFRSAEAFVFTTSAYLAVSLAITAAAAVFEHRYPVRPA
ncbi:amino acid ABC transporter permease [Ramlibacter sp.]|uniref:amino acid ABC transporter permease n=1 Tax=Ramlibacter sp. TaxID=1917967 RepID=UPI0017F1D1D4|nr:amino acid ABC transporter permease [Ramlibacter sp.]MBA2676053.1 amino acid ABC transporter permease [Ramlibacter sp.]